MYAELSLNKLKTKKAREWATGWRNLQLLWVLDVRQGFNRTLYAHILSYFITSMRHYLNLLFFASSQTDCNAWTHTQTLIHMILLPLLLLNRGAYMHMICTYILPGVKEWSEPCINNGKENVNLLCNGHCTRCGALQKKRHSLAHCRKVLLYMPLSMVAQNDHWDMNKLEWNFDDKNPSTNYMLEIVLWLPTYWGLRIE